MPTQCVRYGMDGSLVALYVGRLIVVNFTHCSTGNDRNNNDKDNSNINNNEFPPLYSRGGILSVNDGCSLPHHFIPLRRVPMRNIADIIIRVLDKNRWGLNQKKY